MDEEIENEDNINIYNTNFYYEGNDEQILGLYNKKEVVENNDTISKKIIKRIFYHPLFLNYNYCLFCLERRKTKYNHRNLYEKHKILNIKKISNFLEKESIKLKFPENKIDKLTKRRFIHSSEHKEQDKIDNNQNSISDTEIFIEENENLLSKNSKLSKNAIIFSKYNSQNLSFDTSSFSKNSDNQNIKKYNSSGIKYNKIKKIKTSAEHSLLNKNKNKSNAILNEDKENSLFKRRKRNLKTTKKISKPLSFFGFIINQFENNKQNETRDLFMEQEEENKINEFQYFEKNEKCGICLGEIKDKFTLICGDFFCRECIISLIEESINNISFFSNLNCPICKDPINENTIIFLLKGKNLKKYKKQKMRIDGLKNPNNIPCPFPDCEGFAVKKEEKNNIYKCQKDHVFCKKCLEIIDTKDSSESKNQHKCQIEEKYPETMKYFKSNKNIRKCPKCNCWVEREPGGCNYFRCSNIWCKYEFCWICGNKYEPSHYKNPLSTCFRLSESDYQGKLIESLRIRRIRCILIILLLILILFPIICIFFSFFAIISFALYFHFDGKYLKSVRLHSKVLNKIAHIFYFAFIFTISLALIPFGYMCLGILIIAIPIIIIIKKIRKKKYDF